jgi:hypothetical protein
MLLPGDVDEVARRYGLGADPRLTGTVERGEQGQVWQLETELGLWAIKTSFELAEEELDGEDAAFQMAAHGAGVPVPAVVLTGAGRATLRAYLAINASTNGSGNPLATMPCVTACGGISW